MRKSCTFATDSVAAFRLHAVAGKSSNRKTHVHLEILEDPNQTSQSSPLQQGLPSNPHQSNIPVKYIVEASAEHPRHILFCR